MNNSNILMKLNRNCVELFQFSCEDEFLQTFFGVTWCKLWPSSANSNKFLRREYLICHHESTMEGNKATVSNVHSNFRVFILNRKGENKIKMKKNTSESGGKLLLWHGRSEGGKVWRKNKKKRRKTFGKFSFLCMKQYFLSPVTTQM
jgi:hypothetical protein